MAKTETTLIKEKRTVYRCAINGEECYYVVFTDTYKETTTGVFGKQKTRVYDDEKKSMLRFETREKAEQYSHFVTKCDELGEVQCGESTQDTYTAPVIFIYPKDSGHLSEYGKFGCIKHDMDRRNRIGNINGFTFFPYMTDGRSFCNLRNHGCMEWKEFIKLGNVTRHFVKVLKLNIEFPDDELITFEIFRVDKKRLESMQGQIASEEMTKAREEMDVAYERFMDAAKALGIDTDY